jgi:hypothetical protein
MSFMLLGILNSQAAGGGGAAYDLLETTTLTSSASSVTFSGLGSYSDYAHLQVRAVTRTETYGSVWIRFNSDSGSNYSYHALQGNSSTVSSFAGVNNSFIALPNVSVGGIEDANSSVFGAVVIDILDFSSSAKNKTVRGLGGKATSGYTAVSLLGGAWYDAAAVTAIELYYSDTSFVTGTRFSLYGIKGA